VEKARHGQHQPRGPGLRRGEPLLGASGRPRPVRLFEQHRPFHRHRGDEPPDRLQYRSHPDPARLFPKALLRLCHHADADHGRLADLCREFHDPRRHPDHHVADDRLPEDLRHRHLRDLRPQRRFRAGTLPGGPSLDPAVFRLVSFAGHDLRRSAEPFLPDRNRQNGNPEPVAGGGSVGQDLSVHGSARAALGGAERGDREGDGGDERIF